MQCSDPDIVLDIVRSRLSYIIIIAYNAMPKPRFSFRFRLSYIIILYIMQCPDSDLVLDLD